MENINEPDWKKSEKNRNLHLCTIQKARNDMGRLLEAEKAVENDHVLSEGDKDGLLKICENKAFSIYQIMKEWETE